MVEAIAKVGVVGAGQMGAGIAQVTAQAGMTALIHDFSPERIAAGLKVIDGNSSAACSAANSPRPTAPTSCPRIAPAPALADLSDCDLVIEAAIENEAIKRKIFVDLCQTLKKDALVASNTSSISITRLGAATDRPEKFIGIHFMNPVPRMKLVELIRGIATDDDTFERAKGYIAALGKTLAVSEDFPAFIVNRILLPMINEAIYTLYEGVGSVEAIDTAMKLGANHPMGPLQLADFIGLDTCLRSCRCCTRASADSKYRPCPLLVKYVEAGWLGRKTQARLLRLSRRKAGPDAVRLAINLHLSKKHGGPLGPRDAGEEALMTMWSFWAAADVEPHAIQITYNRVMRPPEQRDEALAKASVIALDWPFSVFDAHLKKSGGHIVGGRFTIADINCAEVIRYAQAAPDLFERAPNVKAWLAACQARPAYREMMREREAEPV
jgi:3-hydroxybutyryl-CoA dehydrogenase